MSQDFPSARPSAEELIVTLPLMKPRRYSISSSAEVQPVNMALTVGVLKVKRQTVDEKELYFIAGVFVGGKGGWRGSERYVRRRTVQFPRLTPSSLKTFTSPSASSRWDHAKKGVLQSFNHCYSVFSGGEFVTTVGVVKVKTCM